MWTDSRQQAYSTITAHWIDSNWQLKSHVICTDLFNPTQRKTGVNLKAHILESLSKFGISSDLLSKCIFTTDKGSNIVLALRNEERLDCINHVINRVLQHSLEEKQCPDSITSLLKSCKGLVRYVKTNSIQNILQKSIKQSCDTRWNSTYTMLDSIKTQYEDLVRVFTEHKPRELHRITSIDLDLLNELLHFLEPFLHATKACEGEKEPTIHLVIPWITKLKRHCEVVDTDSDSLVAFKEKAATYLDEKFTPHLIHKTAVFFNPKQKSMRVLTPSDRKLVTDHICEQLS